MKIIRRFRSAVSLTVLSRLKRGQAARATLALVILAFSAPLASAADTKITDSVEVQAARAAWVKAKGYKVFYTEKFDLSDLPAYAPTEKVTGTIRLWGSNYFTDSPLAGWWEEEFKKFHPDVKFDFHLNTTQHAIPGLIFGMSDIGPMGREIMWDELLSFQREHKRLPTGISAVTGSYDVSGWNPAIGVFVHRENPLTSLTLAQLDAIFGTELRRGASRNLRTWGDLGLSGEWAAPRITPYGWKVDEDFALFFRASVLENSHRWNPAVQEFVHATRPDGTQYDHGQRILDALAADRFGIAISNVRYARPEVKPLALAARAGEPAYEPTIANLISQKYRLVRIIPAFIDRAPVRPVEPAVREFLRFVLSREGQQALIEETGYLPLGADAIRAQLEKLK